MPSLGSPRADAAGPASVVLAAAVPAGRPTVPKPRRTEVSQIETPGSGTLCAHYGASHRLEIEWARQVIRLVPSVEVVRFTSSGTEATMMAMRLARAFTGRTRILKFRGHFHGWHDYAAPGYMPPFELPADLPG